MFHHCLTAKRFSQVQKIESIYIEDDTQFEYKNREDEGMTAYCAPYTTVYFRTEKELTPELQKELKELPGIGEWEFNAQYDLYLN